MWTLIGGWSSGNHRHDSSMPGTTVRPGGRAASAADQPAVVSWSVSATTSSPAPRAVARSSAGVSVPSDTEEWVCRSIRIRAQPAPPSLHARDGLGVLPVTLGRGLRWPGRLGVALVVPQGGRAASAAPPVAAEEQRADPPVEDVGTGQEGDL